MFVLGAKDERHGSEAGGLRDAEVALRQWVLTVPFAWRSRLGFDGQLLGAVVRKFADAVRAFYRRRLGEEVGVRGQSGAVLVVQRTSSDLRLNPHVHAVLLDGVFHEVGGEQVVWTNTSRPPGARSSAAISSSSG